MNTIIKYFPALSQKQIDQYNELKPLYSYWNSKINVLSRKDMGNLYEKHILHSLSIAKFISFKKKSRILDVGTGGGFPGIPLAIYFPNVHFHLVDSVGKKIKVVEEITKSLSLFNVTFEQNRAEKLLVKYDFIVSRAVTQMPVFMQWIKNNFATENKNYIDNGILYLKGGDLTKELTTIKYKRIVPLSEYFAEDFFKTKKLVYIKL